MRSSSLRPSSDASLDRFPIISAWPGRAHGCPVEGNRLSPTIHTQPKIPLAGLDPAIYVFRGFGDLGGRDVDARNKSVQGALTVASWLTRLDPTLSQLLNRTAVGRARLRGNPALCNRRYARPVSIPRTALRERGKRPHGYPLIKPGPASGEGMGQAPGSWCHHDWPRVGQFLPGGGAADRQVRLMPGHCAPFRN
jgi:hypothetical protein